MSREGVDLPIMAEIVAANVAREEWGAVPGQVLCPEGAHWMMGDPEPVPVEARFRCPHCRAQV